MQNYQEHFDDEDSSEELGEYEEGLDDDYDDEQYDEEGDLGSDDGEEYVEGEEDDDEEGDGYIRGLEQLPVRGAPDASRPWQGLDRLPATTKAKYVELLRKLQGNKKQNISILLLGKFSTGKSHTTNSLLNEEAAKKQFLNREGAPPLAHTREAHGFTLSIIDTGGLTETDVVSPSRLDSVGEYIASRPIDVVLYVDRFDYFRTDGNDRQVIQGISDYFGADIWRNAVVGLTHACQNDTSMPWEDFAEKRGEQIQAAIRKHGGCPDASLPVAFIENSESCKQNDDGESVLPNGLAWLPDLMEKVTDKAASTTPYTFNPEEVARKSDPNKKLKWLVPVLFAAQIAFKFLVFDKIMEDDKLTGDRHGPYDPAVVASKRRFKALEEERQKRAASARGGRAAQTSRRRRNYDSD